MSGSTARHPIFTAPLEERKRMVAEIAAANPHTATLNALTGNLVNAYAGASPARIADLANRLGAILTTCSAQTGWDIAAYLGLLPGIGEVAAAVREHYGQPEPLTPVTPEEVERQMVGNIQKLAAEIGLGGTPSTVRVTVAPDADAAKRAIAEALADAGPHACVTCGSLDAKNIVIAHRNAPPEHYCDLHILARVGDKPVLHDFVRPPDDEVIH